MWSGGGGRCCSRGRGAVTASARLGSARLGGGERPGGADEAAPRAGETRRRSGGGYGLRRGTAAPAGRQAVRRRWRAALLPRPRRRHGLGARHRAHGRGVGQHQAGFALHVLRCHSGQGRCRRLDLSHRSTSQTRCYSRRQKPLTRRLRLRFPRFSAAMQVAAPLRKNGSHCIRFRIKCLTWFYYSNAIRNRCHGPNFTVKVASNYPSGITKLSLASGTRLLLLLGWRRPDTADGRRSSAVEPEAPARDAAPCGPALPRIDRACPSLQCAMT